MVGAGSVAQCPVVGFVLSMCEALDSFSSTEKNLLWKIAQEGKTTYC
jgi:hypothetical protein